MVHSYLTLLTIPGNTSHLQAFLHQICDADRGQDEEEIEEYTLIVIDLFHTY